MPACKESLIQGAVDHFSTAADIHLFQQIATAEDAILMSRVFQDAFQEIEDSAKPVVAVVAGNVVATRWRLPWLATTAWRPPAAASACRRSIWGSPRRCGTQRLPRLVGPITALQIC